MNDLTPLQRTPFQFGRAIFMPFRHGPGSGAFVFKSAVFYAVVVTMLFALFGKMLIGPGKEYFEAIIEMEKMTDDAEAMKHMGKLMGAMGRFMLYYLLIILGGWAVWATIEAALHRRVLRDERRDGLFPWRFGVDELLVMLSHLVLYMCYMGLYMVSYFVIIIGVLIAVLLGSQSAVLGVIGGIIAFALIVASLGLMFWVLIRLAPTSALSVANKEFAIGEAWAASKGRFWPIFGAYAFHYIIGMFVFYSLMFIVGFAFVGSMMGEFSSLGSDASGEEVWAQMQTVFSKRGTQVGLVISGFLTAMFAAIWLQLIAGINTYVVELYKKDKAAADVELFE